MKSREKIASFGFWFFAVFSVILLSTFYFLFSVSRAEAATLYLAPASGTYSVGKNFVVSVRVSTPSEAMNAADGVLNFPTDKLQVIGLSKTGSIFNLWVQDPSYSNSGATGNIHFEGVVLNPGFTGDGKILEITFQVRSEGVASVSFASGSVLANDGEGTNIVSALNGGNYTLQKSSVPTEPGILPPKPFLKHYIKNPDGESVLFNNSDNGIKWSNNSYTKLVWSIPIGVDGVAEVFDDRSDTAASTKASGLFDSKTFNFLEEGRHYYHLRFINSRGAGPILHYPLFVDLTPPEKFNITLSVGDLDKNGRRFPDRITFKTGDGLSGLDYYEVMVGDAAAVRTDQLIDGSGEFLLTKQKPGPKVVTVRALDKAGNFTDAKTQVTIESIDPPVIIDYPRHLVSPGQKLVIVGTALPEANVEVSLQFDKKAPLILSVKVDGGGDWTVNYADPLPSGYYRITAKQILSTGLESDDSNPVYMSVNSLFWKFFVWIWNVGGLLILVLVIIALLAMLAYYYWHKFRMFRKKLRREAREVEESLARGVAKIKKELERGDARQKISQDLGEIKKEVDKELKDLDKKI